MRPDSNLPRSNVAHATRLRVGSVSFLNAKPLIFGLERSSTVDLRLDIPSRLLRGLKEGRFDVALLPVIDYQRMAGLEVIPVGGIGCDGPTLTVRLFSEAPFELTRRVACDTDSHTSVALARVILAERFGLKPEFQDLCDLAGAAAPRRQRRCDPSHRRQGHLR